MSPGQAIEYALSDEEEREPPTLIPQQHPPPDERTKSLTRREREVALFVARGLTNRRIASELSISKHTVANHVRKILKKMGLRSKAQIGTYPWPGPNGVNLSLAKQVPSQSRSGNSRISSSEKRTENTCRAKARFQPE